MSAKVSGVALCFAIVVGTLSSAAEDDPVVAPADSAAENATPEVLAGHSYHGEVFNEGPRQKAYLMGGTGHVRFPVTSSHPDVQAFVEQGIGQLYGFWYFEAERSFRQAAALDPDCAMAYWGAAMANLGNTKRATGFMQEAIERKQNADQREVMYIEALDAYLKADAKKKKERDEAYQQALETIIQKYPDDLEAKAFLALHMYNTRGKDTKYEDVEKFMQEIFAVEPLHSTHHFRIHLWDYKDAKVAVNSAAVCGQTSPNIAHMWHMPGHIFSKLKRYNDAAWQQEASARVDHENMMRDGVLPDQIHNFAHNNEWLIRNLINVGRVHDAVDLAKNMTELPRHPKYNTLSRRGSAYYGRTRLFQVLSTYELWDEMIAYCNSPYLEETDDEAEQLTRLRYLGGAHFRRGDVEEGNALIPPLREKLAQEKTAADKAEAEAVVKVAAEIEARKKQQADAPSNAPGEAKKECDDDDPDNPAAPQPVPSETDDKDQDKSLTPEQKQAKQDADRLKKAKSDARKPFDTKIRNLQKAVDELEGHAAVAVGDYKQGLALLKKAGGVDTTYLIQVQWLAGETEQAEKAIRDHVEKNQNEVQPLATLIDILWKAGKRTDAAKTFHQLRELSGPIDIDAPVFARLAPIAEQLWLPADWRVEQTLAADIGERPALDSLGPFRWQPSPAPEWTLHDANHGACSSKDFAGRPVVVIFYLGYGCLHCAEQLQAFGPVAQQFEDAGISLVAISTDGEQNLKKSIDNYKDGDMPIPLVANDALDVFKRFRVYDDFENQPLHGTFLIDGNGLIRWQDISYEPFMDAKFVLNEAQRLLDQDAVDAAPELSTTADACGAEESESKLVHKDDFEDGAPRWQPTDPAAWQIKKTADGQVYSQFKKRSDYEPPHRSPLNISLLKDVTVGDFELNAKVLSTHEDYGHRDVCLFFGYQNPAQFYYVHLGKQTDDHANQIFIVNNAARKKISTKTTDGTNWDDKWHDVRIIRRVADGTIEVYFDDMKTPVMTATDKTFTWGQIGLGSFDDTSDWDNVELHGDIVDSP